jgi:hypothetical protein
MPDDLQEKLNNVIRIWRQEGLPSRSQLLEQAEAFQNWRTEKPNRGLWIEPPKIVIASLDDGMGIGLEIIRSWSEAIGLKVHHAGLLKSSAEILDACRRYHPAYLGLTVLQLDSEEALAIIGQGLPLGTKLIAGGTVFAVDPELAMRTGVHFVAKDVGDFLRFFLLDVSNPWPA